jgi:nucleoside-diphosphate-sugar epimerase
MENSAYSRLLVIGGSSLVGRRLRELAPRFPGNMQFTGHKNLAAGDHELDADAPQRFSLSGSIDAVIVCAPISRINAALLQRLYDLGMRRLVVFSSTSILTKTTTNDPLEQSMLQRLQAGEELVRSFCVKAGVAWTILRPTMIYDEGLDQNVSQIMRVILRLGFFPIAGNGRGLRRPVHAADLASAALSALTSKACAGKTYSLSGGEVLTYKQMVARIFWGMGRAPRIIPIPLFIWRIGFLCKSLLAPGRAVNFEMARRMNKHMNFEYTDAAKDFGYSPRSFQPDFGAIPYQAH